MKKMSKKEVIEYSKNDPKKVHLFPRSWFKNIGIVCKHCGSKKMLATFGTDGLEYDFKVYLCRDCLKDTCFMDGKSFDR